MPRAKTKAPLGASLVVLSSFFYASYGIWTKLIGNYFGAFTQATLRHVLTASMFLGLAFVAKQFQKIHWLRDARWLALSFVSSAVIPALMFYSILNAGVGVSLTLAYLGIVIGMFFFGWLFAGERFTRDKWLSTLLGLLGLALIFLPNSGGGAWWALVAAFGSGMATGLNVVASKKMPYNATQTAALVWTFGTLANLPFIFVFNEASPTVGLNIEWMYLFLFSVSSVIASWSIIQGVKLIEAGTAGILGLLEIVFGVMFGMLFFAERPEILVMLGVLAIIASAAVPYVKDYNFQRGTLATKRRRAS